MKTNRPVLQLPLSSREILLEIASIVGIVMCVVMLIPVWKSIPETIPSHFDLSGKADAMGSKSLLFLMPGIAAFMYALLTVTSRFPHTFNYPFPVTEENAERLYRIGREMIAWIKTLDIWMMTLMNWTLLQVAAGYSTAMGLSMMIGVLVFVIIQMGAVGIGIYATYQAK